MPPKRITGAIQGTPAKALLSRDRVSTGDQDGRASRDRRAATYEAPIFGDADEAGPSNARAGERGGAATTTSRGASARSPNEEKDKISNGIGQAREELHMYHRRLCKEDVKGDGRQQCVRNIDEARNKFNILLQQRINPIEDIRSEMLANKETDEEYNRWRNAVIERPSRPLRIEGGVRALKFLDAKTREVQNIEKMNKAMEDNGK
jgi:hypothetical protein